MSFDDQFELLGRVTASGTTTVWKARDRRLDRIVAVKSLDAPTAQLRQQWREEARVLAALSNPHIGTILGYTETEDQAFIVEEWIEGATLSAVLNRSGAMPADLSLGVVRGALLGLAYVHRQGIVHGDISPTNIMIDAQGTSMLIDFGLAGPTGMAARPGTGAYQAPETSAGGPSSATGDVYAAAAVLAMLLRGRATAQPSLDGTDAQLRPVLARAMAADPAQRYPDAAAFLAALEEAATRRYGAAWWSQAGLGAAALSAAAGVVAVGAQVTSVTATAPGATVPRATVPGATVADSAGPRIGSRAARMSGRTKVLVAGGIAAVAVAAVSYAVIANQDSSARDAAFSSTRPAAVQPAVSTSAAGSAITTAAPSTAPSTPPAPTTRVGTYRYTAVLLSFAGPSADPVGRTVTATWTLTAKCRAGTGCTTTVRTASGGSFPLPASGVFTRTGTERITCPTVALPETLKFRQTLRFTPAADGLPVRLVGTTDEVATGCSAETTTFHYRSTVVRLS